MTDKKRKICKLRVDLPAYDPFEVEVEKGSEDDCKVILDHLNPKRGVFWKDHMKKK